MRTILLDYDGTYTEFPELMNIIINNQVNFNYKVILATMRYEQEADDGLKYIATRIPVYYTNRQAKLPFLKDNYNIIPDLVIDDKPKWLFSDG